MNAARQAGARLAGAPVRLLVVGERSDEVLAHRAIPLALELAAVGLGRPLDAGWCATDAIGDDALAAADGVWVVPGSPYRSEAGALRAVAHARTHGVPFLGTCGGMQHAVLEFARHVLGWDAAVHGELDEPGDAVIALLDCALVEAREDIVVEPGSHLGRAYGRARIDEAYRCRYGIAPAFRERLLAGGLRPVAHDAEGGAVRAVELAGHSFFVGTLFQPERRALAGEAPPIVAAFARAAARHADGRA